MSESDGVLDLDPDRPRHSPNCGKCRNHGIIVPLRGHKRDCRYKDCECESCILTVRRRIIMAAQNAHIKMKRLEKRRGEKRAAPEATPTTISPSPPDPISANQDEGPRVTVADLEHNSYPANELIKLFGLEMNALPFAYAVLGVSGGIQSAIDMITAANKELAPKHRNLDDGGYRAGPSSSKSNYHNKPIPLIKNEYRFPKSPPDDYYKDRTPSPPRQ